ncbi:MAG: hypothetical protein A2Z16_02535 [Chloroflexi bacterium RBG_16_54_18]|nr:MAG: hypothetical protein A2Z16_02535 [Chloroflexi bacterium RBG_16_54_18]
MNSGSRKLGINHYVIILLTLATAGIHLSLLFPDLMFMLNAIGYLTLLALYFLPVPFLRKYHALVRWAFIGFTLVTISAWLLIGDKSWPGGALGYITKAVEVLLVIFLFTDRQS